MTHPEGPVEVEGPSEDLSMFSSSRARAAIALLLAQCGSITATPLKAVGPRIKSGATAGGDVRFLALVRECRLSGFDPIADIPDCVRPSYKLSVPNTDALLRIAYAAAENGDFTHARRCYEQGAALGDFLCLHALGHMHDVGEGVPENKTLAMKIYRRAWRLGSHASATNIAVLYREQGKIRMMFRWYQRVVAVGDGSANLEMAKCYIGGSGVRKNAEAALRCLATAIRSQYISEYEREEAQALLAELSPRLV